jgi:hypothetical protein
MKYILVLILLISVFKLNAQQYDITKFGAKADSNIIQTKVIQKVIDRAAAKGGGEIVIPEGTFLSGALFFKKKTKLVLQEGAVLKGSDDIKNYPFIASRMEGRSLKYFAAGMFIQLSRTLLQIFLECKMCLGQVNTFAYRQWWGEDEKRHSALLKIEF